MSGRGVSTWMILAMCVCAGGWAIAQSKPRSPAAESTAKFKAIFEPVNYTEDLELVDVLFISDDEGWVSGQAGTILHTTDGGATWEAQLGGDPQGTGRPIVHLRYAGERTIFAAQASGGAGDHHLLRTTDGKTWTQSGTVGQHRTDYQFTSADHGVYLSGGEIHRTTNGGKTWTRAYACSLNLQIGGLARKVGCHFESVHFPTPQVGFAISRVIEKTAFAVARTDDGGATWTAWPVEHAVGGEFLHFHDASTGIARMWGGALYVTDDGGKTWTAVPGVTIHGGKARSLEFADREVGWAFYNTQFHFTTNGGRKWTSREIQLPAAPEAIALPSRQRGYAVGEHGMVYRYRIVPADYKAANMVSAPMMPAAKPGAR